MPVNPEPCAGLTETVGAVGDALADVLPWFKALLANTDLVVQPFVEVRVDEGPWQPAPLDPETNGKYSWKLFTYIWNGATAGEHTLVSRVTDVTGKVQPTEKDLETKKSFLEDNSQHPRKVMIS